MKEGNLCVAECGAHARYVDEGLCIWITDYDPHGEVYVGPVGDGKPEYDSPYVRKQAVRAAGAMLRYLRAKAEEPEEKRCKHSAR
jgi:hypothetical protein